MRLYLRGPEIDTDLSWRLLAWCAAQGAEEFSLRQMSLQGHAEPNLDAANARLAPFRRPTAVRPRTVVYEGRPDAEPTELWTLDDASIRVLRDLLPEGLFTAPSYDDGGWLEEPTVYRRGRILLGVVSHEDEAFMELDASEVAQLAALRVPFHATGVWI